MDSEKCGIRKISTSGREYECRRDRGHPGSHEAVTENVVTWHAPAPQSSDGPRVGDFLVHKTTSACGLVTRVRGADFDINDVGPRTLTGHWSSGDGFWIIARRATPIDDLAF